MSVITIARQLGAGGAAVARSLSERLGWRLLDRALVERIAAELQVEPEQVEACDERVESFVERLGTYLSEGYPDIHPTPVLPRVSPERAAQVARRLVAGVVHEGPAVIVGHGAQCVLREEPRAFHALVHSPRAIRIERARERYEVSQDEAEERIRQSDANRRRYIRDHFDREWLDPTLYHICVDVGRLGMETGAEIIADAATRYFGSLPQE
ncbi:MAG: cytidylate kinase-like family protein [Gemmatimonadetes bacterium]|nr:cytidylate kinase-like family protein [Gemmatimonadota bacterium]